MAGLSLDPQSLIQALLATQAQQSEQTQQAVQAATSSFDTANQKMDESLAVQREVVVSAGANAAAKANADYMQAKAMEDLQRTFNLDQADQNNEIAKSLATVDQVRQQRAPIRAEYDRLASTDLLTNPIGYIFAQLQLPAIAAKNNALADAEDLALQNIDTRTRQLTAAKSVLTANTADQLHAVALQDAQNQQKVAEARLLGEEAKNAVQRAAQQMQISQLESKALDDQRNTIVGVSNIAARAEAREDARQARADAAADRAEARALRLAQLEQVLTEKQEKAEEEARLNERLKTVSTSLGLVEPMTVKNLKALTNKKEQMLWLEAATTGQLGSDLKDSLMFYLGRGNRAGITAGGGASMLTAAQKLAQNGAGFEAEATRMLMAVSGGKMPKKEEAQAKAFELYQASLVGSMNMVANPEDLSASKWDKVYNPYQAQFLSLNKAIDSNPTLAPLKSNIVKTTVDDLVKSGAVNTENLTSDQQQQVLTGIIAKVRAKQLEPKKAAADIAAYFTTAARYNGQLVKPELFALPTQDAYLFTVNGTFGDSNRKKLNLMDAGALENGIIWYVKQQERPFGVGDAPFAAFR